MAYSFNRISTLIGSTTAINGVITQIETAINNLVSKTATNSNQMSTNLDMNSKRILNLPLPTSGFEPLRLQDAGLIFATYNTIGSVSPPIVYSSGITAKSTIPITSTTYNGELYICTTSHTTTGSFDSAKWQKIVSKGDISTLYAAQNTWSNSNTWAFTDTQNTGVGNFYTPWYFSHAVTTGATGSRNAAVFQVQSSVSTPVDFLVPLMSLSRVTAGSGNVFGLNGYVLVDSAADATTSASGGEFNTDIRRNITNKTGCQIVDVATSVGTASNRDAGLWIAAQTGAAGYKYGIELSFDGGASPVRTAGSLFKTGAYSVTKGLDWASTTFTGNIFDLPNTTLTNTGQLSITRSSPGRSLVLTGGAASDLGGEIQQTNPTGGSKFLRVSTAGIWEIVNSSYTNPIFSVSDLGLTSVKSFATNPPVIKTSDYTVDSGTTLDSNLILNGTGTITLTLPSAASFSGRVLKMKTIAAFTVVSATSNVTPLAGGAASTAILAATAGKWVELQSDGSTWIIVAAN